MPNLTDKDRQALRLADDLQKAIDQWLGRRGVEQSCVVSPFVDPSGEPAVIIKMNARAASAMIDGLRPPEDGPVPPPPLGGSGPAEPFPGPPAGPPGPSPSGASPSGYFPFKP